MTKKTVEKSDNSLNPEVSILVLTYNRRSLLERNLNSIFKQTFKNYEILLLDDCSSDDTEEYVRSLTDERIRYYRNEKNMGKEYGDWWAIRKSIYELMRGKYFIYLCDDDYWYPETLLEELVDKHHKYPNLSLAFGMHGHCTGRRLTDKRATVQEIANCYTTREMFPEGYMTGLEYLSIFSSNPCGKNYLEGASLFSREKFLLCNAFNAEKGTKWQAGYMFKMGPAVVGDVFFIDKPCVIAGVDSTNASYSRTQVDHFWDIVSSIQDSRAFLKASPIYKNFRKLECKLIDRLYTKAFNKFVQTWWRNQVAYKAGVEFPDTPNSYFQDKLTFRSFRKAFSKTGFKIELLTLFFVFNGMLPSPVILISVGLYKMTLECLKTPFYFLRYTKRLHSTTKKHYRKIC